MDSHSKTHTSLEQIAPSRIDRNVYRSENAIVVVKRADYLFHDGRPTINWPSAIFYNTSAVPALFIFRHFFPCP